MIPKTTTSAAFLSQQPMSVAAFVPPLAAAKSAGAASGGNPAAAAAAATTGRLEMSTKPAGNGSVVRCATTPTIRAVTPPPPEADAEIKESLRRLLGIDGDQSEDDAMMVCTDDADEEIAKRRPPRPVMAFGHRGAVHKHLENTREGFLYCARELGVGVELDVFLIADNTLVVFHGGGTDQNAGDLSDYCVNADGVNILDLTYEQVQNLRFKHYEGFPCPVDSIQSAKIPTLEQVLSDLKPYGVTVKVELKGKYRCTRVVQPVIELVERLNMVEQCHFSSFDHSKVERVRQLRPQVDRATGKYLYRTAALFPAHVPDDFVDRAIRVGASEIHMRYDTCTASRIREIKRAGLTSLAWFRGPKAMVSDTATRFCDVANREGVECYQAVIDAGIDALCVNHPDVLVEMFRNGKSSDDEKDTTTITVSTNINGGRRRGGGGAVAVALDNSKAAAEVSDDEDVDLVENDEDGTDDDEEDEELDFGDE